MLKERFRDTKFQSENYFKLIKLILFSMFIIYLVLVFLYDVIVYYNLVVLIRVILIFIFTVTYFESYEKTKSIRMAFLGISLCIVGILDLSIITFAWKGNVLDAHSMPIFIKLWTLARFIGSISFLIVSFKLPRWFDLKNIIIAYIFILILGIYISLKQDIFPDSYKNNIEFIAYFKMIKYIIFYINIFTLLYNIFKTKMLNLKENKLFIFIIAFIIFTDAKFIENIHEKNFLNFIFINLKLISYFLIFNYMKNRLFNNIDFKIDTLNKYDILEYALESSLEGIIIIGNNKKVIYSNNSFNNLINYQKGIKNFGYKKAIKKLIFNVKDSGNLESQILESIETGEDWVENIYFKNGEVYNTRSFEFKLEGESLGRTISFSKVTEKIKVEQLEKEINCRVEEIADLKQMGSLKIEFVGNIIHDFRTPITIIMSTIQLWDMRYEKTGDYSDYKFTKENFKYIKQNCRRLLKLTNNLIDLTKISRGYMKLDFNNHNIVYLVEDITMSVVNYAKREEISLIFDTDTEEKVIGCHRDSIERIILNLLSNAIKFTSRGGKIEVDLKDRESFVIISIKDNGIGIPKKMQKEIFNPFKQVNSSDKREKEGSGIGLSLVKFLVEEHGGKIYINDKLNIGTEFIIELPLNLSGIDAITENCTVDEGRLSIELSDI